MGKTQIFQLDKENKYVKKLIRSFVLIEFYPIITMVIALGVFAVNHLLSIGETFNNAFMVQWIEDNASIVLLIFGGIAIIQMLIGIYRFFKNLKVQNSLIIKEKNYIMIIYRANRINQLLASNESLGALTVDKNLLSGVEMYLKGTTNAKIEKNEIDPLIKEVIDNPKSKYLFYTDCRLLKETRKYYLFNGNNIDYTGQIKNKNFKIDKIYSNIEQLINE